MNGNNDEDVQARCAEHLSEVRNSIMRNSARGRRRGGILGGILPMDAAAIDRALWSHIAKDTYFCKEVSIVWQPGAMVTCPVHGDYNVSSDHFLNCRYTSAIEKLQKKLLQASLDGIINMPLESLRLNTEAISQLMAIEPRFSTDLILSQEDNWVPNENFRRIQGNQFADLGFNFVDLWRNLLPVYKQGPVSQDRSLTNDQRCPADGTLIEVYSPRQIIRRRQEAETAIRNRARKQLAQDDVPIISNLLDENAELQRQVEQYRRIIASTMRRIADVAYHTQYYIDKHWVECLFDGFCFDPNDPCFVRPAPVFSRYSQQPPAAVPDSPARSSGRQRLNHLVNLPNA